MTQDFRQRTQRETYHDLWKVIEYLMKFRGIEAEKARAGYMISIVMDARKILDPRPDQAT